MTDEQFLAEALADIRQTMIDIAALHAAGQLSAVDMSAAVHTVETNCLIVEAVSDPETRVLPLLTLADVTNRARRRAAVAPSHGGRS